MILENFGVTENSNDLVVIKMKVISTMYSTRDSFKILFYLFQTRLDLATFRRETPKEAPFKTETVPESIETKYTIPIKYSPNITQIIQNTAQKINSNITQEKALQLITKQTEIIANNMENPQTQKKIQRMLYNTTIQQRYKAQKKEIILNDNTGTPTQSKYHQMQQMESPNITQNALNIITQKNANTKTNLATSNEDRKMNIDTTMESTLIQHVMIPMPDCKLPSDLG